MNSPVTIDASVFVSAFTPSEAAHQVSKEFMREIQAAGAPIIVPTLVIPEIAAAIGRGQEKPDLGFSFAMGVGQLPNVILVDIDKSLAETAAEIAATHRLRGSDAVYAAVALRFGTNLVTLDREQQERLKTVVPVSGP
ncbi:MAG: type II toxin-antitoxin system VapC family toxin [Chloroflexota bacterium]